MFVFRRLMCFNFRLTVFYLNFVKKTPKKIKPENLGRENN